MTRSCTETSTPDQQTPAPEPAAARYAGVVMVDELVIELIRKQLLKSSVFQH